MAEVSLRGVHKRFGEQTAVEGIDLDVADGELLVLLGPTGAGKTTTLRLIAGLEKPDEGEVRIGGRDVTGEPPAARDLAFVFQQYSLYPHLTAYDNLAFPLRAPGRRNRGRADPGEGRGDRRVCCRSNTSSTARRRCSRAARCSASPSDGRWCAIRPPI